jgi:hypothetical protein
VYNRRINYHTKGENMDIKELIFIGCMFGVALCLLALVRNTITYSIRMTAITAVGAYVKYQIYNHYEDYIKREDYFDDIMYSYDDVFKHLFWFKTIDVIKPEYKAAVAPFIKDKEEEESWIIKL